MLTIYTPQLTNRITFVMDVVFNGHLHIPYQLTESVDEFKHADIGISYAPQPVSVENEVFIWQHAMMVATDIQEQTIDTGMFEDEPVFFQSPYDESLLPFDIFALSFYLLTRYEEYLPHPKDTYGRFPAKVSLACQAGFLQKPLVDILVLKFAQKLQSIYPALKYDAGVGEYIATYDIDNAYAYLHKGLVRTTGGLIKQLFRFDFKEVGNRLAVLFGGRRDPFDTYAFLELMQLQYGLQRYYFILCAEKSGYDRGLNPQNREFQKLVCQLHTQGKIGCHPSFASSSSPAKLSHEINTLSGIIKEKIRFSRTHYLLLDFPVTYQQLIANGITMDFTLGYPELPGFRASTSKVFPFFDLSTNRQTPLQLLPFAYMEETFQNYMRLKPGEALDVIKQLIDAVKSVNGTFVSLWHNENFEKNGEDWKTVYEQSLTYFFS